MSGPRLSRGRILRAPLSLRMALRKWGGRLTPQLLMVSVRQQQLVECETHPSGWIQVRRRFVVSTSKFGIGQQEGSFQTPLGLHRVARKIGAGQPLGTVFKGRRAVGVIREGKAEATICHRILWLEGLEPGLNRGGSVDSRLRYIYIHGFGDEATLGRPASHGCIHMAAADLIPLFNRTPERALVWIEE